MKKVMILFLMIIMGLQIRSLDLFAEDIYYPFDSITIVEAFKFDIQVTTAVDSDSLLFGHVEINEILTIYVGTLEFIANGVPSSGSSTTMLTTLMYREVMVLHRIF